MRQHKVQMTIMPSVLPVLSGRENFMSYTKRKLEDLNLLDDFLMNAVTYDSTVGVPFCRRLLSELLQKDIDHIEVSPQLVLPPPTPDHRGVRLDVEIKEPLEAGAGLPEFNLYDVEPYLRDVRILPKHNRFYQARIDSRHMHSGDEDFQRLPNLYVITITRDDPFGKDQMVYTVRNKCQEIPDLDYQDGLVYYYFNTTGTQGGNAAVKALLDYLGNSCKSNVTNERIKELDQYVSQVKMLPEVRDAFMRFEDIIYWAKKDAREEGLEEGRTEGRKEGRAEGRAEAAHSTQVSVIMDLLEEFEPLPDNLKTYISSEDDSDTLRRWVKLAAKATSLEDFKTKIGA